MSIVFAILKIIGIVLLALFLLVLFLLLLLLFAPVRYRVKLVSQGAMPNVEASASYLFPLLHFRFSYREKEGANGHLRLLWFSFPKEYANISNNCLNLKKEGLISRFIK